MESRNIEVPGNTDSAESALRLEYILTPAERKEASTLATHQQFGGGNKWLARIVMIVLLIGLGLRFWFQIVRDNSGAGRYVWIGIVVAIWIVVFTILRRKENPATIIAELSSAGLHFGSDAGQAIMPWSAFAKLIESPTIFLLKHRTEPTAYILPKRVFPSQQWIDWLRATGDVLHILPAEQVAPLGVDEDDPDAITIQCKLGYFDFLDVVYASWFARGVMLLLVGVIVLGTTLSYLNPNPVGQSTSTEMLLFAGIPSILMFTVVVPMAWAGIGWLKSRQRGASQTVKIADAGLTTSSKAGVIHLMWKDDYRWKQTFHSLLIWKGVSPFWLAIPRRAFASRAEFDRCRDLIARKVKQSRWFLRM